MTEEGEQILAKFYAFWDRKVRKGLEQSLYTQDGFVHLRQDMVLENFLAWILKHYRLTEIKKR